MKSWLAALFLVCILSGAAIFLWPSQPQSVFSAEAIVADMNMREEPVRDLIAAQARSIIQQGGIPGLLDVVGVAFKQEGIFMNDCHALAHLTGHYAITEFGSDYDHLLEYSSEFCARGYWHGAEAQIVLEGGDFQRRLGEFCQALKRRDATYDCFHGAGHALMNQTLDVDYALALCDTMKEEDPYVASCYEGVFSEFANVLGGFDGELGIPYEGGPPITIDVTPMEYCAGLDRQYHAPCSLELNALGIGKATTIEQASLLMQECLQHDVTQLLRTTCLYNIASSYTRQEILRTGGVSFQPWVNDIAIPMQEAYMVGVGHEISAHVLEGHYVDTDAFCDPFASQRIRALCKEQVVSYKPVISLTLSYE